MERKEDSFHLDVKALISNGNGQLLILKKNTSHSKSMKDTPWDLPGGRIHKNEPLEEALKREVYEETGLQDMACMRPLTMALTRARIQLETSNVGLILAIYLCEISSDDPRIILSDEHILHEWVSPSEAAERLAPNFPVELIEKIAQLSTKETHEISKISSK